MPRYLLYCDYYQLLGKDKLWLYKTYTHKHSLFQIAESKEREIIILFKDLSPGILYPDKWFWKDRQCAVSISYR